MGNNVTTIYHLTLDKAAIIYKNGNFLGSSPDTTWSPISPYNKTLNGWQDGDKFCIVCTFNLNPDINPQPDPELYAGLCVGACKQGTKEVDELVKMAKNVFLPTQGQILTIVNSTPIIVTEADNPPETAIFYNAIASKYTYTLPNNRGKLKNYIYKWEMTYNGNNTIVTGKNVEIIFGYGDPHVVKVGMPVRKKVKHKG